MGIKVTGNAAIATSAYKDVKFVGKTKDGRAVTITVNDAVNLENIDFTLADKDEVVAKATFTGTYEENRTDDTEPWSIEYASETTGTGTNKPGNILLGYGAFYIGEDCVGLCRGGGQFTVEYGYRNIEADGDLGPVKDRIAVDSAIPKLTMNLLEIIKSGIADVYPTVSTTTTA